MPLNSTRNWKFILSQQLKSILNKFLVIKAKYNVVVESYYTEFYFLLFYTNLKLNHIQNELLTQLNMIIVSWYNSELRHEHFLYFFICK